MYNSSFKLNNIAKVIPRISLSLLVLLVLFCFCPVNLQNIQAEEIDPYTTQPTTIALAVGEAAAIDITPTATGQFGKTTAQVNVTTNSNAGYKLYLNTADPTNAMYNVNSNSPAEISAVNGTTSEAEFLANEWGYTLTSETDNTLQYQAMPLTATMVEESPETTGTYNLSFGAMVDTALPAGQYVNNVLVSAVANPSYVTGLMSLTYMQDMTTSTCADTKGTDGSSNQDASGSYIITPGNEPTKQLIDIRDGKEYWVAKLADGNCWMVQNLAYDLVKGKVLTPSDSDVSANWVVPTSTETKVPEKEITPSDLVARSWNLGKYVLATPSKGKVCSVSQSGGYVSLEPGQSLDACADFQEVGGEDWRSTFVAQDGLWNDQEAGKDDAVGIVAVNKTEKTYDAHYLIGNYYQWGAATAGSGNLQMVNGAVSDVVSSICARGWRLPGGGQDTTTWQPLNVEKSYYSLLRAYGYPATGSYLVDYSNAYTLVLRGMVGKAEQDIVEQPLFLVMAGRLQPYSGDLSYAGHRGGYHLATMIPGLSSSYFLNFNVSNISPTDNEYQYTTPERNPRAKGLSMRCVAR